MQFFGWGSCFPLSPLDVSPLVGTQDSPGLRLVKPAGSSAGSPMDNSMIGLAMTLSIMMLLMARETDGRGELTCLAPLPVQRSFCLHTVLCKDCTPPATHPDHDPNGPRQESLTSASQAWEEGGRVELWGPLSCGASRDQLHHH